MQTYNHINYTNIADCTLFLVPSLVALPISSPTISIQNYSYVSVFDFSLIQFVNKSYCIYLYSVTPNPPDHPNLDSNCFYSRDYFNSFLTGTTHCSSDAD